MEIILIQDVDNLGAKNEVVKVKNGYARNYLLPRQLAVENNPSNARQLEERMKQVRKKEEKIMFFIYNCAKSSLLLPYL